MATKTTNQRGKKSGNDSVTTPARRSWMKKSLGALGALGLGGVAACAPKREEPEREVAPPEFQSRNERVFIFKRKVGGKDQSKRKVESEYEWVVSPAHKFVRRRQMVIWRVFANGEQVTFDLPTGVFEDDKVTPEPAGIFKAKVKADAPEGYHGYGVKVGGKPAIGGSDPGIIVDR